MDEPKKESYLCDCCKETFDADDLIYFCDYCDAKYCSLKCCEEKATPFFIRHAIAGIEAKLYLVVCDICNIDPD